MPDSKPANLRTRRSRKDRPCDACRKGKRQCYILERGQACEYCARTGKNCIFLAPPLVRHRKDGSEASSPSASTDVGGGRGAGSGHGSGSGIAPGTMPLGPPTVPAADSPPGLTSAALTSTSGTSYSRPGVWMGERSTLVSEAKPSAVLSFLDSLEDGDHVLGDSRDEHGNYSSLDMDNTEEEESHYLGSGAVAQIATVALDSRLDQRASESLGYRQVADRRHPAYFLKNPSRVYGVSNAAYVAEKAYDDAVRVITAVDARMPEKLVHIFMSRVLPALPILNQIRLEASVRGWHGAGQFPHALLVGIYAATAVYEPSLRQQCKELWAMVLHVLDNEYRQARLQTLQLQIIEVSGRPILTPGGNHIGICRGVGAAQLLGLHRDCSRWKLPLWERSLRRRLWWNLYVHDKWNSYTYGRPMNVESARFSIPPLTLADDDWYQTGGPGGKGTEIVCFMALCRLSTILEKLLPLLLDREGQSRRHHGLDRPLLRQAALELDGVYRDLPDDLVFNPAQPTPASRPGLRALQLSHYGIALLICRLGLEREEFLSLDHLLHGNNKGLHLIEGLVVLLESLQDADYWSFWYTWSAYQLCNPVTLLLQQAIRVHQYPAENAAQDVERERALADIFTLLGRLVAAIQHASEGGWEVGEAAMPRIKSVIKSVPPIPGIETVQIIVSAPIVPAEWSGGVDIEPDADMLALFDWLNGDMTSAF